MSGETFNTLLEPNLQSVRRFVQRRLRNPDHLDDVVQQTLLLAFTRRDQLRAESKFRSWLWSIALNEIRATARRSRYNLSLDEFPNLELPDPTHTPHASFEQAERARWVHAGIATLGKRDQVTIRLVDLNGLTVEQAAGKLSLSKSAVKSTHYRAIQRLRRALRRVH